MSCDSCLKYTWPPTWALGNLIILGFRKHYNLLCLLFLYNSMVIYVVFTISIYFTHLECLSYCMYIYDLSTPRPRCCADWSGIFPLLSLRLVYASAFSNSVVTMERPRRGGRTKRRLM